MKKASGAPSPISANPAPAPDPPPPRLTQLTSSLNDSNHPGTLLNVTAYNAFGGELAGTLGSGLALARTYTPRGWLATITDGSTSSPVYNLGITSYAPNGDPLIASDSVNGNWNYSFWDLSIDAVAEEGRRHLAEKEKQRRQQRDPSGTHP